MSTDGQQKPSQVKQSISWVRVLFHLHVHVIALAGIAEIFQTSLLTLLWSLLLVLLGHVGVTLGAHRLWAHRAYKASTPLKAALALCYILTGQGTLRDWVLRHRLHHRHLGTKRDPCNVSKGFFYTHLFSNILVQELDEKEVDLSDLENDSVAWLDSLVHWPLVILFCVLVPVVVPVLCWGESLANAVYVAGVLRFAVSCHGAWLVYSAWHVWGLAPGDRYPSDTPLVFVLTRSHWPRYHHAVPWDWRTGEFGTYDSGPVTSLLRVFAALDWVTELRTLQAEHVREAAHRAATTGRPFDGCLDEVLSADSQLQRSSRMLASSLL